MCGRYFLMVRLNKLRQRYDIKDNQLNYKPPGEIYPTQQAPVIIADQKEYKLKHFKWGFTPSFTNKAIINARGETVDKKQLFADSFKKRRCLIPINAFFEWKKTDRGKKKYRIGDKKQNIISLAGLYNQYKNNEGRPINCFTIITTQANKKVARIHHRMPVILTKKEETKWLNPNHSFKNLKKLLHPYSSNKLYLKEEDNDTKEQLRLPFT